MDASFILEGFFGRFRISKISIQKVQHEVSSFPYGIRKNEKAP